ncbi:uncharacterized protein N0V89_006043 [Didymosphaeria variabile]|uniref:Xaa-Pro dipeptidyl-peptidase C-terminal domain-containing protein n=1 Tax=Didymosphaeria variabile TaxID=1932322 RepID=A0A9W9CC15_9PLEO|nr:uncharacterized protein N0V89_006043 [Didymosphaeria variabile]KAJ4354309.1 hypothetical protein N0V89_006043 [Didymosphaeria variabile]
MAAINRTILGRCLDRWFAWTRGLPAERCNYSMQDLKIPIDTKNKVTAKLYLPLDYKPCGTILIRTPYGIDLLSSLPLARMWAARGYQVLLSSCRGTAGSDDELVPGVNEANDGAAVVTWMRDQHWYSGSFAMLGGSYLGYTQWAILRDPPSDFKAAVIHTGVHSFHDLIWGTGALGSFIIAWADLASFMNRGVGFIRTILHFKSQNKRLKPVYDTVPLLGAIEQHFEGDPPTWLRNFITNPEATSEVWKEDNVADALRKANIPIFLTAGWDDLILPQVMQQYSALTGRNCPVALTIGPWTHLGAQRQSKLSDTLAWLDQHIAGLEGNTRRAPVQVYVTGASEWRDLARWPPPSQSYELFLRVGGKFTVEPPSPSDTTSTSFTFDPADPTPSVGHPLLFDDGPGRAGGNTALATRKDVLTFTTEPLDSDLEVCGQPLLEIHHSTSSPHADLLVLMNEVDAKGFSRGISEKYMRLPIPRDSGAIEVILTDCAHRFRKGSRIQVIVAGGSHPKYLRNLGTEENAVTGVEMQKVEHTVHHGSSMVSRLVLPVTPIDK